MFPLLGLRGPYLLIFFSGFKGPTSRAFTMLLYKVFKKSLEGKSIGASMIRSPSEYCWWLHGLLKGCFFE